MEPRAVVEHLLFHKAILGDGEDWTAVDRYLAMVEEIGGGMRLGLTDPVERSVAAAFELVLEQRMDPWAIDLVKFAHLYMEKVRGEGRVDFIAAGRLILMAWSVLRMQSEGAMEMAEPPAPVEETPFVDWDLEAAALLNGADAVQGYPLARALRHHAPRSVTLMDLVEALRQAEARMHRAPRSVLPVAPPADVEGKVHGEELAADLKATWEALLTQGDREVPLAALWPEDRSEAVALFLSLLFLARMGWVSLQQPDLKVDDIMVEILETPPDLGSILVPREGVEA